MTTDKLETGGPMFAQIKRIEDFDNGIQEVLGDAGCSIRTYAAIHLRVAMSEHDWLNDMIRESQRQELAKAAMQGCVSAGRSGMRKPDEIARLTAEAADAMLAGEENHRD